MYTLDPDKGHRQHIGRVSPSTGDGGLQGHPESRGYGESTQSGPIFWGPYPPTNVLYKDGPFMAPWAQEAGVQDNQGLGAGGARGGEGVARGKWAVEGSWEV